MGINCYPVYVVQQLSGSGVGFLCLAVVRPVDPCCEGYIAALGYLDPQYIGVATPEMGGPFRFLRQILVDAEKYPSSSVLPWAVEGTVK